jgi:UDP-galactose transporter B1
MQSDKAVEKKDAPTGMTSAKRLQMLKGAIGIYYFFITYGTLQEAVFKFVAPDGKKFTSVWFLQLVEALANVGLGYVGRLYEGVPAGKGMPQVLVAQSGVCQVLSKYFLSASLAAGLSFPVATLVKSAKMVPVMVGSLLMGGATFSQRQIGQAAAIVGGTSLVNLAEGGKGGKKNSSMGLFLVAMALVCDGLTGGAQKRIKKQMRADKTQEKPYDMMMWTNFWMAVTAALFATFRGELREGLAYCSANPGIMQKVIKFSACGVTAARPASST